MARRLYLGSKAYPTSEHCHLTVFGTGLPTDARSDDVSKFFEGYGRIIDCRVMTGRLQHRTQPTLNSRGHSQVSAL